MSKKTGKWKIITTQKKFIELYKKQMAINEENTKKFLKVLTEKKQSYQLGSDEYIVPEEWL
ncbi:hypothetical protein KJ586_01095 [Patescibacteria group bacterium]|nr:hypothetical protein [Patescibacteria group bacterium]